jgi:hypothetical protein
MTASALMGSTLLKKVQNRLQTRKCTIQNQLHNLERLFGALFILKRALKYTHINKNRFLCALFVIWHSRCKTLIEVSSLQDAERSPASLRCTALCRP